MENAERLISSYNIHHSELTIHPFYLMRLTIDRLDNDRAVLRTDAGQELVVPRREISAHARVGDILNVRFDSDTADDRTARAQDVLNEILGGTEDEYANGHESTKNPNHS